MLSYKAVAVASLLSFCTAAVADVAVLMIVVETAKMPDIT